MKRLNNYMPLVHYARRLRAELGGQNPFVTDRCLHELLEELCEAYNFSRNRRVTEQLKVEIDLLETAIA